MASIAIWDCNQCQASNIEFIQSISSITKSKLTKLFVFSRNQAKIPDEIFNLQGIIETVIRFGDMAFYDIVADILLFTSKNKEIKNIIVASSSIMSWISLIESVNPKQFYYFTPQNQQEVFDQIGFSFYNQNKIVYNQWVYGEAVIDESNDKELLQTQNSMEEDFENAEVQEESQKLVSNNEPVVEEEEEIFQEEESFNQNFTSSPGSIKPLTSIENNNIIDLRSPVAMDRSIDLTSKFSPTTTPKRDQKDEVYNIPRVYQPLIEAMKAIGKAMIPLNSLSDEFKKTCSQLGVGEQNIMTIINKASDAGLVIFDKTINYVRFRDRKISFSQITYI